MSIINSKEINDKIASLPSYYLLSKELQRQEDIAAINDYALRNPTKVFDKDFILQRKYLTEETWKAVIQANPDMQNSASDKWRKIPDANIVNKYQGQAFSGEVRKAINEDGVKLAGLAAAVPGAIIGGGALAKPVLSLMFYHPGTFFAETIGGAIGGYAGGAATDAITRGVSDYDSFANMIASNSTIPELYAEMLNPGMLLGGLAGGVGGNVLYNNVIKPTAQRVALPHLIARLLNKNIRNTNLGTTVFDDAVLLGKVGWSPKLNVVFKHGSEDPDLQTFIPYETWDVKHRGASPYKYFATKHGSPHNMMDDRPFLYVGLFDLEKPIVLIGEFNVNGAKNTTRNQLVQEARNRGADSYYMKGIYDNKADDQNVIIKFIDNEGETPYMGLTSKSSTLTEAERLGIPKGERNQKTTNPNAFDFHLKNIENDLGYGEGFIRNPITWELQINNLKSDKIGKFIGSGAESVVYEHPTNKKIVLKVLKSGGGEKGISLNYLNNIINQRNLIPLLLPQYLYGRIKIGDYYYPVMLLKKIIPLGIDLLTYIPTLQNLLKPHGFYLKDGEFTNGIYTIGDLSKGNIGVTSNGQLRFIDVQKWKQGGTINYLNLFK